MERAMGFIVLIILVLFMTVGQNNVFAQDTFGPICDGVTVTCPPSPSLTIPPIGQTEPTPTPTPTVYPSATPIITAIPQSGNTSVTVGILIVGVTLVAAGHLSLLSLRRQ